MESHRFLHHNKENDTFTVISDKDSIINITKTYLAHKKANRPKEDKEAKAKRVTTLPEKSIVTSNRGSSSTPVWANAMAKHTERMNEILPQKSDKAKSEKRTMLDVRLFIILLITYVVLINNIFLLLSQLFPKLGDCNRSYTFWVYILYKGGRWFVQGTFPRRSYGCNKESVQK